jgi:hypothetical protein
LKKNGTDGDGVLTVEEATGEYGTVLLALSTSGVRRPKTRLTSTGRPVADLQGGIDY